MSSTVAMSVALNTEFQSRVSFYLHKAAVAVFSEGDSVENHYGRTLLAKRIVSGDIKLDQVSICAMTNPTLESAANLQAPDFGVTDNDLEFVINSIYNLFV